MEKSMICNVDETHQNLFHQRECLFFRQLLSLLEEVLQVALITELSNDVAIVGSAENFVAFEYV